MWVHLVLHPHGIAPLFLRLDSWSLGAGYIAIISTKGINHIKKENCKKNLSFMHTKIHFLKDGCNSTSILFGTGLKGMTFDHDFAISFSFLLPSFFREKGKRITEVVVKVMPFSLVSFWRKSCVSLFKLKNWY